MRALILALILAAPPTLAMRTEPTLEGTAWKLLVGPAALPDGLWSSDLLVFSRGRFGALEYLNAGFAPGAYRVQSDAQGLRWSASLTSASGSRVQFEAVRRGRKMTGRLRWLDAAGGVLELPFKAVLRPRPALLPPGF